LNIIEALNARRSTRAFLPKLVEKEKLTAILEAASRTPSWASFYSLFMSSLGN